MWYCIVFYIVYCIALYILYCILYIRMVFIILFLPRIMLFWTIHSSVYFHMIIDYGYYSAIILQKLGKSG